MNNHIRLFAVLGVGISFGLAIFGFAKLYPLVSDVAGVSSNDSSGAKITVGGFDECVRVRGSVTRESYPPVCVTRDGQQFTKSVPPIKWPEPKDAKPITTEEEQNGEMMEE